MMMMMNDETKHMVQVQLAMQKDRNDWKKKRLKSMDANFVKVSHLIEMLSTTRMQVPSGGGGRGEYATTSTLRRVYR